MGNGGLVPGTYQYRDDNGGEIVQGNECYLHINLIDPVAYKRIKAEAGQPFTYELFLRHKDVKFEGYDGGCTGDASVGYGLYRVGD